MRSGNAASNYDAPALIFRHVHNNAHMKDSEVGGHGTLCTVNVGKIFRIAKAADYRGYYSLEREGRGGPCEGIRKLLA